MYRTSKSHYAYKIHQDVFTAHEWPNEIQACSYLSVAFEALIYFAASSVGANHGTWPNLVRAAGAFGMACRERSIALATLSHGLSWTKYTYSLQGRLDRSMQLNGDKKLCQAMPCYTTKSFVKDVQQPWHRVLVLATRGTCQLIAAVASVTELFTGFVVRFTESLVYHTKPCSWDIEWLELVSFCLCFVVRFAQLACTPDVHTTCTSAICRKTWPRIKLSKLVQVIYVQPKGQSQLGISQQP